MDITLPYRILAIDPASGKSGWTILDLVSLDPFRIIIVKHAQIDGQKLLRTKKEMSKIFPDYFCILDALEHEYMEIMKEYKPDQVVSESAFAFIHISAFASLKLVINAIRRASWLVLNKDITEVPPTITKMAFTGKGGADKDLMRWAYRTNDYLMNTVPDDQISEHEIDAVGHGVGHIMRDILKTVIQLSGKEKRAAKREKAELKKQKEKAKLEGKA
jgi:Holliday junction resolvasome RuvABC endonuclease subunit